jgi:hypothetical protein
VNKESETDKIFPFSKVTNTVGALSAYFSILLKSEIGRVVSVIDNTAFASLNVIKLIRFHLNNINFYKN